jgi:hypothetical protein
MSMSDYLVLWASTEDRREASEHLRIIQQIPPWGTGLMRVIATHREGDKLAKYRAFALNTNRFGPALVDSHTTNG